MERIANLGCNKPLYIEIMGIELEVRRPISENMAIALDLKYYLENKYGPGIMSKEKSATA